ncbi:NUDIX domain-containing protein [Aurantimicrobium minutum]|uniref:NUDIX domain-containing protein n=1 Tax=Aurantimicrobium minutum TaxID=708131 RepID=UPI0024767CBE|nr:NUDIX domain-containing protein [Aurantimicrobium minutum]MDH6422743.1 8-oxo-dGTP diphosphatase [Aurantimicrobium minutum]
MGNIPPHLPPPHLRDPGDAWAVGPDGQKFWGAFGAAGLLVWHRTAGILLQHRAEWSHHGGTWGIPGGAIRQGEDAITGALREANEEAGVPQELVTVLFTEVLDLDFWSYTTVVVESSEAFEPVMGDSESEALAWIALSEVESFDLHPGFGKSWPELKLKLEELAR